MLASASGSLLNKALLSAAALLPWTGSFGGAVAGNLPRHMPQSLREWLNKRLEKNNESSPVEEDFFSNNGRLLAVPKKKVTHQKKRQRLYAPGKKQLKMLHHLNRCPSCGHYKRANCLCMHCFQQIRHIWKTQTVKERSEPLQEQGLSNLDKRILYPGKKETEYKKKLKDKESYLDKRMRSLPVEERRK